jgi:peptidoglycan/LPS O-acetylase OafA/YrhL
VTETAPTAVTGHHLPALNGLRAIAVLGVVAYHLQFGWASGGYLGVDLFFVLSGFLITSLILEEWVRTPALNLAAFWGRRAKRLLPALFLVVAALGIYLVVNARLGPPGANGLVDLSRLRGDAISTLLYVGNWHAIYAQQSYFAQFSTPSPLQHTWSLAIEEQFYLVWPPVLLLLFRLARRSWRQVGLAVAVVGALASAALMALLFHPGTDPTRVYYGTDTRLFDLMAGAAIAFMVAARPQPGPAARRALHVLGPAAAAVLAVFWVVGGTTGGLPKNWMFDGGFLLCAVLAGIVVADARLLDQGWFARALSSNPLHFIGTISYGIYLWHWPIIVYLTEQQTGLSSGPLNALRVAVTLAAATASYYLVERPIRRATFKGSTRFWLAPLAGVTTAVILLVCTIPAVADPTAVATAARPTAKAGHAKVTVPGAGGYGGQRPITLPAGTVISPQSPLRVMIIGDSVIGTAEPAIKASLESTGDAVVFTNAIDGFGLTTLPSWPTDFDVLIAREKPQIIIGAWSWDVGGPTTPNALHQPKAYTALLERFMRLLLTPGNGVDGVLFTSYPLRAEDPGDTKAALASDRAEDTAINAWSAIAAKMPSVFPRKVMYLPVAGSLTLHGRFPTWLPPVGDPKAPSDRWLRVRYLDTVHLCPEGASRYANAVLTDLTAIFHLPPANPDWFTGTWSDNPEYNQPPGACPDDHPPASN